MKDNCENYHGAFFAALHAKQQEGREPAPSVFEDNGDYETQCNTAMLHDPTKGFETEADFDEAYLQAQEERI
ncbi:MAG: hypothetical protein IMZ62_10210 [Chloroflexi bacterium]|nr:hypothetical protein [Chloroflexota bacterium]